MGFSKEHDFSRFKGVQVTARPDEDPERMVKRFMKKVREEGVTQEAYERSYYEKPSVRRRRKSARARFIRRSEERGRE
jgi:small subunit ribosomal protein S21